MNAEKRKGYYSAIFFSLVVLIIGLVMLRNIFIDIRTQTINNNKKQINYMVSASEKALHLFVYNILDDLHYLSQIRHIAQNNKMQQQIINLFYRNHRNDKQRNYIYAVSRIDTNGYIVASAPDKKVIGVNVKNQKHNNWALKHRKPLVSDVFKTVQGEYAIAVVFPVFYEKKFQGLISVLVPFDFFARSFLLDLKFGENSKTYLIQKDGTILFSENSDEIGESFFEIPQCLACEPVTDLFSTKGTHFREFQLADNSDKEAFVYYKTINVPQNEWKLLIYIPATSMLLTLNKLSSEFITVELFVIFSTLLAFVTYNIRARRLTAQLIEKEHIFKVVSDKTMQLAFEFEIAKDILKWFGNSEEIIGYTREEISFVKQNDFIKLIHPDDRNLFTHTVRDAVEQKKSHFEIDFRLRHKHGKYIYVHAEAGIIVKKGKPYKLVGSLKDITFKKIQEEELRRYKEQLEELVEERTAALQETLDALKSEVEERKEKEKQLEIAKRKVEAANKLKSEFLAQMSHEIRTPINVIISYTSLLQVELENELDPDLKEAFHAISTAGDRIIRTVELILNMTDLQTGSFEPHFQEWDVYNQILRRVFLEYLPKAKDKNLALILNEPKGDTNVTVDEFSVRNILSNIVDNAIKYTDKGHVAINTYRNEENKLVIEISDTGIGIDEEYLPFLFEAFSQEQQGYTRKFEGNGLGLALVKQYCEINNIDIKVKSKKGEGTAFILTFNNA